MRLSIRSRSSSCPFTLPASKGFSERATDGRYVIVPHRVYAVALDVQGMPSNHRAWIVGVGWRGMLMNVGGNFDGSTINSIGHMNFLAPVEGATFWWSPADVMFGAE